jgi:general stress protein CsbA
VLISNAESNAIIAPCVTVMLFSNVTTFAKFASVISVTSKSYKSTNNPSRTSVNIAT